MRLRLKIVFFCQMTSLKTVIEVLLCVRSAEEVK
jgi:hypothetical protein